MAFLSSSIAFLMSSRDGVLTDFIYYIISPIDWNTQLSMI